MQLTAQRFFIPKHIFIMKRRKTNEQDNEEKLWNCARRAVKSLIEQRAAYVADYQGIIAGAKAEENRAVTDEESTRLESLTS